MEFISDNMIVILLCFCIAILWTIGGVLLRGVVRDELGREPTRTEEVLHFMAWPVIGVLVILFPDKED